MAKSDGQPAQDDQNAAADHVHVTSEPVTQEEAQDRQDAAQQDQGGQEPVPVKDQKAAGVPPEETVTVEEQKKGTPPPPEVQVETIQVPESQRPEGQSPAERQAAGEMVDQPDPADHHVDAGELSEAQANALNPHPAAGSERHEGVLNTSTSNESPSLVPGAQSAAARAHAYAGKIAELAHNGDSNDFSKIVTLAEKIKAEVEKHVPAPVLQAAETVAEAELRTLI